MGCVYFSIPVIGGYYTWLYVNQKSVENIGRDGVKLKQAQKHEPNENTETQTSVGVKLVKSTDETQKQNREMLQSFLKAQKQQQQKQQRHNQVAKEDSIWWHVMYLILFFLDNFIR